MKKILLIYLFLGLIFKLQAQSPLDGYSESGSRTQTDLEAVPKDGGFPKL